VTFTPDTSPKSLRSLTAHIFALFLCWTGGRVDGVVALPEEPPVLSNNLEEDWICVHY
jgi:hypothetical protein